MKKILIVLLMLCAAPVAFAQKWGGYVVTDAEKSVTEVEGSWAVPAVACSGQDFSRAYFWVGIDGGSENDLQTVEQIGIAVACVMGTTTPDYSAFYEFVRGNEGNPMDIPLPHPISANDTIKANASFDGTHFTLTLSDLNTGDSSGAIHSPDGFSALRETAEWIVEQPPGSAPLADFGTVFFGKNGTHVGGTCYATVAGHRGPIGDFKNLVQLTAGGLAIPSPLSPDGSSFFVTSTAGMVAWWPADGNNNCLLDGCPGFSDIVGGNNGTPVGTVTFAAGEVGQAFSFDGVSSFVNIGTPPTLNITGPITVDAWIKPNVVNTYRDIFDQMSTSLNLGEVQLRINPQGTYDFFRRYVKGSIATQGVSTQTSAVPETWQHVAAVYDGSAYYVYINGVPDPGGGPGTGTLFEYAGETGPGIVIGTTKGVPAETFGGLIDEVEIFNRALSASEIQAMYNAGKAWQGK